MRCLKFWRVLYTILPPAFIGAPMVAALLFLGSRRAAGQKRRSAGRRGCPAPSRSRFRSDRRKKSENFSKSRGRPSSRCRNLLGRRGCPAPSRSRFRSDRRKKMKILPIPVAGQAHTNEQIHLGSRPGKGAKSGPDTQRNLD